jgi:hypothetical protein
MKTPDAVSQYLAEIGRKGGQQKGRKGTAVLTPEEMRKRAQKMVAARRKKRKERQTPKKRRKA